MHGGHASIRAAGVSGADDTADDDDAPSGRKYRVYPRCVTAMRFVSVSDVGNVTESAPAALRSAGSVISSVSL